MNNQNGQNNQEKEWYESLWGVVVLGVVLNVLSSWIYDRGRDKIIRKRKKKK